MESSLWSGIKEPDLDSDSSESSQSPFHPADSYGNLAKQCVFIYLFFIIPDYDYFGPFLPFVCDYDLLFIDFFFSVELEFVDEYACVPTFWVWLGPSLSLAWYCDGSGEFLLGCCNYVDIDQVMLRLNC